MRKLAWSVVVVAGAALVSGACATAAEDPPPAQKTQSTEANLQDVDRFCAARADVECNDVVMSKCQLKDHGACLKARTKLCLDGQPQGTKYIQKNAPACFNAIKAMYEDAKITSDESKLVADACGPKIFSGPGAARSPCTSPYDCSSENDLTCVTPEAETNGKCLRPVPVPAGSTCAGESDTCPDDYYCDQPTKTCQIRASAGASCHITIKPCKKGLRCPPPSPFGNQCLDQLPAGTVCSLDTDCRGMCVKAPGQAQGTCADAIELTPLGEECSKFK